MAVLKRSIIVGWVVVGLGGVSVAQEAPGEAKARMEARQARRKAAATQPTALTTEQVEKMRLELLRIRKENADLKQALVKLEAEVQRLKPKPKTAKNPPKEKAEVITREEFAAQAKAEGYRLAFSSRQNGRDYEHWDKVEGKQSTTIRPVFLDGILIDNSSSVSYRD